MEPQYAVVILGNQQPCAETEGAGKNSAAVVIGVLTDKVDATRGEEYFLRLFLVGLLESLFHFLCCHSSGKNECLTKNSMQRYDFFFKYASFY